MSAQQLPSYVTGLCPSCGSWLQGESEEVADNYCRAVSAYTIALHIRTKAQIHTSINSLKHRENNPLPPDWPEPINWTLAAQMKREVPEEIAVWIQRQAEEYK